MTAAQQRLVMAVASAAKLGMHRTLKNVKQDHVHSQETALLHDARAAGVSRRAMRQRLCLRKHVLLAPFARFKNNLCNRP